MNLSINKDILLEKLNSAARFTSSKLSSLTTLQGILIKAKGKEMHFYSTNLNVYYHTKIKQDMEMDFEIVIEPRKLMEFLSLLSAGKIDIEIKEKDMVITQNKTRGDFSLMAPKDFPLPPEVKEDQQEIRPDFFLKNLPLVLFSASSDETRPVLTGVDLVVQGEELLMVTTDGFRLSMLKLKKEINLPSLVIPSSFLSEVLVFLKGQDKLLISYSPKEKLIKCVIGDNELCSRLIEGDYPPFERVIPSEKKTTIETDRDELLKNIKLISIFARDISNIVIIQTTKEGIHLKPKAEVGEQNITYQDAKIEGEEQRMAFNYKFLLDFVSHADSKKIIIELLRPDAPAVFKTEKNPNLLHIIMPVRIQE